MFNRSDDWEVSETPGSSYENVGYALLGASAVVALLMTLAIGFPFMAPIIFPFAFLISLLVGLVIGMPIFLTARSIGRANAFTAGVGGFLTGAAVPAVQLVAGNEYAGQSVVLLGAAGMVGGAAFWSMLTRS